MEQKYMDKFNITLLIDSGAHSIFNKHAKSVKNMDRYKYYESEHFWNYVDQYAAFIKRNDDLIDAYVNVDAITNPEMTWKVQMYLEKEHGLRPIPVIHHKTDHKWLKRYLSREYDYIALGGVAQEKSSRASYIEWANTCFKIIAESKTPNVKVHGFAVTALPLLFRYPWYSVDSSSWRLRGGGYGLIDVPRTIPPVKKSHHHIHNLAVSNGTKGFGKRELNGFFTEEQLGEPITQATATLSKYPEYTKKLEEYMASFGFDLYKVIEDGYTRAVWNAVYLLTTVKKFSKTKAHLAISGDTRGIRFLEEAIVKNKIDLHDLHYLESYYSLPKGEENCRKKLKEIKGML